MKNVIVPADVKAKVTARVQQCLTILNAKYHQTMTMPAIEYSLKGTTAGTADYMKWVINLNSILLMENLDHFIMQTVGHEVSHLACDRIYPAAHRPGISHYSFSGRSKREVHGPRWQSIMRSLGLRPDRCHKYDTTNAAIQKNLVRYTYVCSRCGTKLLLTAKRHQQLQASPNSRWHKGCSGSRLILETAVSPSVQPQPQPVKPVVKTAQTKETKLSKCKKLFENYPGYNRAEMINAFVQVCDCTPAGAATYYNLCRNS